jgi:hypothetical protein
MFNRGGAETQRNRVKYNGHKESFLHNVLRGTRLVRYGCFNREGAETERNRVKHNGHKESFLHNVLMGTRPIKFRMFNCGGAETGGINTMDTKKVILYNVLRAQGS